VFGATDGGISKESGGIASELGIPLIVGDKRRDSLTNGKADLKGIFGIEAVKGKNCIAFDDILDTGGSANKFGEKTKEGGAKKMIMIATHPIISDPGPQVIQDGPFDEVWVANTCPLAEHQIIPKLRVFPIQGLTAGVIKNLHNNLSITDLWVSSKIHD
jgi:ribose-phosphate pyrophosphokinase